MKAAVLRLLGAVHVRTAVRGLSLVLLCAVSANAWADSRTCMIIQSSSPDSQPVEATFDDDGRIQWMGPYQFTWDQDRIARVTWIAKDGTPGTTWIYTYGPHRELLSAVEKREKREKAWFTGTWKGTFGAARKVTAPLLYGTPLLQTFAGYARPFTVYEPNAVFSGTLENSVLGWTTTFDATGARVEPGITRTYDEHKRVVRIVDTSDRYGSQQDFTYDKRGRVVTLAQSFDGKLNNTTSYRYTGCTAHLP